MTTRDDQTGLMNLGAFTFVVDHVIRRASRGGECATLLTLKLDIPGALVKGDNDPVAVYRVARILRTELRGEDVVARIGPREFGVALPDTNADGGETVVSWLSAQLLEHSIGAPGPEHAQISIGRATFEPTNGPIDAAELLAAARRSLEGPSIVAGSEGRPPASPPPRDELAERRLGDFAGARRHLRALRPQDS